MRIHFIGIGGIGVSALAKYYLSKGHQVSGSDLVSSEITESLKKQGAQIIIGLHQAKNLPKNADLIIHSPAIEKNNPEIKQALKAKNLKNKIFSYPQALGQLTEKYFTIAVSGTHGKSTTTALIGLILTKAGLDPTVIIGTKLKEFGNSTHPTSSGLALSNIEGSNCRVGKSKYLVIEADEHFASFLNYWPKIIVLTNIEADHLDYYKNLNNLVQAFKKYVLRLPEKGHLIINKDDKIASNTFLTAVKNVSGYSLKDKESQKIKKILKVPGDFNISNALAALAVARILKVPDKKSFQALSEYKGAWRRFEIKQLKKNNKPITLVSDYAHHPTEIKATLKAAREKYPQKKICCIFQPHQYQRTYYLFDDFIKALKNQPIDLLIITDIYDVKGREEKKIKNKVSSEKIAKKAKRENVIYLPKEKITAQLDKYLLEFDVLIVMGAGDIYNLGKKIMAKTLDKALS